MSLAPYAKNRIKTLFSDLALEKPEMLFQPGKVLDRFPGFRIYISGRDGPKLRDVEIFETDNGISTKYIRALRAEIQMTPGVIDFNLNLHSAHIEMPKNDANAGIVDPLNNLSPIDGRDLTINFPLSKLKEKTWRVTASMKDTASLWNEVSTGIDSVSGLEMTDKAKSASLTEVNMRYSFSFACITFALVGIPLGVTAQRRETSIGFALSLIVATCYIVFIIFANTLNEHPGAKPHLLMWVPNVIFITIGSMLFRKLTRK